MTSLFQSLLSVLRRWNTATAFVVALLALALCPLSNWAQSGAGSIQGTVTDATGAVIPGASIQVVNQATGVTVGTKSNGVGFYSVPGLFTGTYNVSISAPGMKTNVRTIDLLVAQSAVINATMTPGAVNQQVRVSANAVQLVDKANGALGSTLENARINQLPMNGRNILTLVNEVTPGLDACNQSPSCANGMMPASTTFEVDGVTLESDLFGGENASQAAMPDPDSIQEVQMVTSGESAQYATPATGIITTKSGTNQLHGTLFETARNNGWGIAKSRQDPSNFAAPEYIRNEFGGSLGGPIVIPHVYNGMNKSFWFFAYERYSLAQLAYTETKVPTLAMRNGDWSGLVSTAGILQQLYDPDTTTANAKCPTSVGSKTTTSNTWCRTPFTDNQIPMSRISPFAQVLYATLPPPTTDINPAIGDNFDNPDRSLTIAPTYTFRLDQTFSQNNRAYLRFTSRITSAGALTSDTQPELMAATVNGTNYPADLYGTLTSPDTLFATAAGFTHIFSPTFFSQTVLSQQWFAQQEINSGPGATSDVEQEFGLPNNFGEVGFPEISNEFDTMNGTQGNYGLTQIISVIDESLTKTWGKHQFQFGASYRHERFGYQEGQAHDEIVFDTYGTALEEPSSNANYTPYPNTGYDDADTFIGAAESYNVWHPAPFLHARDMEFDGWFQDDYHVAANLTLNLGLRYEAHPAPSMHDGTIAGFDVKNDALVLGAPVSSLIAEGYTTQPIITNIENDGGKIETAQQAGFPSTLLDNYDLDFLPRVGFAWSPYRTWRNGPVIRGSYGRYTYPAPVYFYLKDAAGNAPFQAEYSESYVSAGQSPDDLPNYLLRAPQTTAANYTYSSPDTPVMGVNTANVVNTTSTTAIAPGINNVSIDPDDPPDQVTQANVTFEQPTPGNSAVRISWVFSHDSNMWENYYFNGHPSTYVWEMQNGIVPPTGDVPGTDTYSATATGPYDKTTWGDDMVTVMKTGWSTDNALQLNYLRLFHRGVAWQISYLWSKPMHTGGELSSDGNIYPRSLWVNSGPVVSTVTSTVPFLQPTPPPPLPQGDAVWEYFKAMGRYEYYRVDTYQPKQEIKFNYIVDLPIGRGTRIWGNANRFANELVGGWQLAGDGGILSQDFLLTSTNWGPTSPLVIYKHKMPITDCETGVCFKQYEWFNGYVAPAVNANGTCKTNCISGLAANWTPYQIPIDNTGDGSNDVDITLPGGKPTTIAYSPDSGISGGNPFSKTTLNGPFNWTADAALFKVFPLNEQMNLRFDMDVFNLFNVQGQANPDATNGITPCTAGGGVGCTSLNAPRQIQFTLRLSF